MNMSDGILRIGSEDAGWRPDGSISLNIEMFPTANTFLAGHRVRLQVSSGAHPVYARNPGTGEPLATATRLVAADQEVFHDPDRPSTIFLPVVASPVLHGALAKGS